MTFHRHRTTTIAELKANITVGLLLIAAVTIAAFFMAMVM